MTTRFSGTFAHALASYLLFLQLGVVAATAQPAAGTAEPTAPKPTAAVETILHEARRLAEAKQPTDSLKTADQALDSARQANDKSGEAFAQQARGQALQDLQRKDEALAAWQEAVRLWGESGYAPEEVSALVQAGLICLSDKESDAEKLFAQGLTVAKSATPRLETLAQALYDSGLAVEEKGQGQTAIDYLSAALTIRENLPESVKFAESLNALAYIELNVGSVHADKRWKLQGKNHADRANEMARRLAPHSSLLLDTLRTLGFADELFQNPSGAREHYLAALQIQNQLPTSAPTKRAQLLNDLGDLESNGTNFGLAHKYLDEAVVIAEQLAPDSRLLESSLMNLSILEREEGDLATARVHLERSAAIMEKRHANMGPAFVDLGVLAMVQYDFASAHDYLEKALAIFTKSVPDGTGVIASLSNLSLNFYQQGDLTSALEYERRTLALAESKWGEHLNTAGELDGMAEILRDQGKFSIADEYFRKALAMYEKLAPGSFYVSETLLGLAKSERAQGRIKLAMEDDRRALRLAQASCPDSECVPGILNHLGELTYQQGHLDESESYLRRAVEIREKSLGPNHPDLARSLNDLAITIAAKAKNTEALADALRAEEIGSDHLRLSVRTLSERQALAYEAIRASGLDLAATLAANPASTPSTRREVFEALIRSRSLVFDELASRHRSAYVSDSPEIKQLADHLFSARSRLATLVFRGAGDSTPEVYRKLLDDAREQKEAAERRLAEKSAAFRQDQARAQLGLNDITASLPQGTALVAYLRYARHDLRRPAAGKTVSEPVPSYAAFVLRAGKREPEFVRLGSAREIDRLVEAWRRAVAQHAEVAPEAGNAIENIYLQASTALRRKMWDSLVPFLGNAREVFVVPDAGLHLVNLASLPVSDTQYLIETGPLIHYLSTERDLVPSLRRHGEGILVVGNPAFDQASKVLVASSAQAATTPLPVLRGSRSACGSFQTLQFPPLPASQQEAENIALLWKKSSERESAVRTMRGFGLLRVTGAPLQMTGGEASVEAFEQNAPGKRVLHIATHGFFLESSCESGLQRKLEVDKRDEAFLPATAENPLLLSGLAFAGANRRVSAKLDESDGILTAEEIASLNLEGVDWAVLSACNTGVGEIKVGEGVFGLRRAFQLAGAKTVIMSLWPIEDEYARKWMTTLYAEHFLKGNDTAESVRAASMRILQQRRAKHQSTHPFYWGAFIAAGDWN